MIRKDPDKMYVRELRYEVYIMRQINDNMVNMLKQREKEIERLKSIDRALYDYKGEIAKAEQKAFARESFEAVVAHRAAQRSYRK